MNNIENNEMLTKILVDLSTELTLDEDGLNSYVDKLKGVYCVGFRHDYSAITRILFLTSSSKDTRDILCSNIYDIYEVAKENTNNDIRFIDSLRKLWDHINLENIRMIELTKIAEQANTANEVAATMANDVGQSKEELELVNREITDAKNELKVIQTNMKNSTTESITILSIFAGIVMAFSGGMSFISNAISGINKIGPYRLAIFILLIGNVMFNVIFLLLYMIGKITGKYTGSNNGCPKARTHCECRKFSCYIIKYPYIAWFNFLNFVGIVMAFYLSIVDRFNIFSRVINKEWYWLLFSIVLILIIVIIFCIIANKLVKYKCGVNQHEEEG